jgi:hypothetical protein
MNLICMHFLNKCFDNIKSYYHNKHQMVTFLYNPNRLITLHASTLKMKKHLHPKRRYPLRRANDVVTSKNTVYNVL